MTASRTSLRQLLGSARAAVCPWLARFERRLLADDGAEWFQEVCCTAGLEPDRPPAAGPCDAGQDEADLARHIAAAALLLASDSRQELPRPAAWYEHAFVLVGSHAASPWAEVAIRAALQLSGDAPCAADRQPQRRIGRYELLAPIGFGASSTVYRAVHADSGRHAAVKLMRLDTCDPDHVLRFRREARFAAALHHPGIAQVLDSGVHTEGGLSQPYLVFELIEGQPFSAFAAGRPLEFVLRTFADVCAAVHHAHLNGIVHRDLKPANVLVDAHGAPHVLDFGVATSCDTARSAASTATGRILGTPSFMSPEQARGSTQDIGPASDVFSLGAILFDALVGSPPFDLALVAGPAAMRQVAEQEPRRIDVLRPDLPADLVAIVRCALAVEPRERYPDAGALEADVRRHLAGEFVAARTPSRWRQLRRSLRRHRLLAMALLALTVGATVSTAAWIGAARMERAYRNAAEEALDSLHTSMVLATELSELTTHSGTLRALAERTLAALEEMYRTPGSATTPRLRELERGLREVVADLQHRLGLNEPALEQRRRVVQLARADYHGGFEATRELARVIVKLGDSLS